MGIGMEAGVMREQIQAQIDALNRLADLLHHKCENLIAAEAEGIADKLEAAIRTQWVPVSERLPSYGQRVFVINRTECGEKEMMLASSYDYDDGTQWFMDVQTGMPFEGVTHWHEIEYPEPPEASP